MKRLSTLKQLAERAKCSVRHIQRERAKGKGPPVIELGDRAIRVDDDDGDAWIAARRKPPPGWVDRVLTDTSKEADAEARTEDRRADRKPAA